MADVNEKGLEGEIPAAAAKVVEKTPEGAAVAAVKAASTTGGTSEAAGVVAGAASSSHEDDDLDDFDEGLDGLTLHDLLRGGRRRTPTTHNYSKATIWVLVILLFYHAYDAAYLNYMNDWARVSMLIFLGSFLVAVILDFTMEDRPKGFGFTFFRTWLTIFTVMAISVAVPRLVKPLLDNYFRWGYGVLLFFPIAVLWFIFMSPYTDPESGVHKIATWYIMGWILFLIFSLFANMTVPLGSFERGKVAFGAQEFRDSVWEGVVDMWDRFLLSPLKGVKTRLNSTYSSVFYSGRVEQNSDRPLGVTLEDVKPMSPYVTPEDDLVIWGYISAESFLHDSLFVTPTARIDKHSGGPYPSATCDPLQAEVFRGADAQFECVFPGGEPFTQGSYPVEVTATFDFETWADVTFEFVTEERARDLARLGLDLYHELDIQKEPQATYTNGPVSIGMGGSRMPILVQAEEPHLKNAYFGFSFASRWPDGTLNHVDRIEVKVPKGFTLYECERAAGDMIGPSEDPNDANYNRYVIEGDVYQGLPYTTVRCKLGLTSMDVLPELTAGADKASRTFIVTSKYSYTIKDKTTARVDYE